MLDVLVVGRAGIDLYSLDYGVPLEGARRFAKYVGGTAANVAVGCARLGLKAGLATRVSSDEMGRFIRDFLAAEGVDVSLLKLDAGRKTGIVFAEVTPGKDSKFIFYRENAADLYLEKADLPLKAIRGARLLQVTGTGLSREPSLSANLSAAEAAMRLGKTVLFNLDWRPPLWAPGEAARVSRYRRMLKLAGIVVGNEAEYKAATGASDIEAAIDRIPGAARKTMVITKGEKGATVLSGRRRTSVEGFEVPLLKGLGGGDGFLSGFLFGHLKGWGLREAVTYGCACGAIVVSGHSCSESMPRPAEVADFLEARGFVVEPRRGPSKG